MNRNLVIPDQPTSSVGRIQETLLSLAEQLNDGATAILLVGVELASGDNKLRHSLRVTPRSLAFSPYSNVAWHSPTRPDATFLYITTAGAVSGDLQIWL